MPGMNDKRGRKKPTDRQRLGALASAFSGLLGGAADSLQGRKRDKKGNRVKTKRQRLLDSL